MFGPKKLEEIKVLYILFSHILSLYLLPCNIKIKISTNYINKVSWKQDVYQGTRPGLCVGSCFGSTFIGTGHLSAIEGQCDIPFIGATSLNVMLWHILLWESIDYLLKILHVLS